MLPELETILHRMRADRLSGATALVVGVCDPLRSICERLQGHLAQKDLEDFALSLVRAQPNMGGFWTLANGILHRSADVQSVASFCGSMSAHCSSAPAKIAEIASPDISGKRVLTASSSSAVFHTLVKSSSRPGTSVLVCESRPMREGVLMARELGNTGVSVTVIADAALALFSSEAAVALAGADTVNRDGVIAKIGLVHLAMACDSRSIPLLVLADSSKFAPIDLSRDSRDPSEILEPGTSGVTAENRYFEHVPFEKVSSIVSEKGRLSAEDAQRAVWGVKVHPRLAQTGH